MHAGRRADPSADPRVTFLPGLAVLAAGGVLAAGLASSFAPSRARDVAALAVALVALLAGSLLAAVPAVEALLGMSPWAVRAPWAIPGAAFAFGFDRLSGFFVLLVLVVGCLCGLYGFGYLGRSSGHKALGPPLLFFNLLVVSLCLVVTATNVLAFLLAWELMTVFAFLLVSFEDEQLEVREAAITYLVITHLGTVLLTAFFLLLGVSSASLDFAEIAAGPHPTGPRATLLFLLALVGFGSKMGVWPIHTWLPLAHPAAPSHVSAVMSGVIVKVAVYALVRGLTLMGPPRPAFGVVLVVLGAVSGVLGVLYALAQHDLKRLLAYHTIENIGIIVLGIGLGVLGVACGSPGVAVIGLAGGLLHVLNHALFKGLLFFGAGAVLQATGTRDIELLGGLARRMPWTAGTFLVASVAICGLPPLNGFVSEWLVYGAAFRALRELPWGAGPSAAILVTLALALIGGLAAACFAKAFGVVFLGQPRSPAAEAARECSTSMLGAMLLAAAACAAIGLLPGAVGRVLLPMASEVAAAFGSGLALEPGELPGQAALSAIGVTAALTIGLTALIAGLRWTLLGRPQAPPVTTWGCGYGAPSARMQYSASSFADPLLGLVSGVLRPERHDVPPRGPFPGPAARSTHTDDWVHVRVLRPGVSLAAAGLRLLRPLQAGGLHLYLLYIFIALVLLLSWPLLG